MISVVMAAYNSSKYIGQAIESILNQTFQKFELIIIDDSSTDNTLEIASRYSGLDNRVEVMKVPHGGISNTRNIGIKEAKYPWIAVMDNDDIALPERLEKQINASKANPEVVGWGTYAYYINSKGKKVGFYKYGPTTEKEFYEQYNKTGIVQINNATALLRREIVLKAGGFNPQFQVANDFDLYDRMAKYGPFLAVPEPLVLYRVHLTNFSTKKFFLTRWEWRYIRSRHKAQQEGKKEPTFEEFLTEQRQRLWFLRLIRYLATLGQFYSRKSSLHFGEGQYLRTGLCGILALLLYPQYFLPRIYKRGFSSEAYKWLRGEGKSRSRCKDYRV